MCDRAIVYIYLAFVILIAISLGVKSLIYLLSGQSKISWEI